MYNNYSRGSRMRKFSHNRSFQGRSSFNRKGKVSNIDESKYIKKASELVLKKEVVASMGFDQLPISNILKTSIQRRGFSLMTPIQEKATPYILEGQDVIGIADTGTGKTAAFLIPIINKILHSNLEKALIIVPTRELAQQIRDELRALTSGIHIYSALCIGGASMRFQMADLRRNPHIIIGTPGRMQDLVERKALTFNDINTVVLDEVDRMLDMGFIHDIKRLLALLPEKRQSLFFSATVSQQINKIIHSFMNHPITVSVKTQDTSENVEQDIIRVEQGAYKFDILQTLLKKDDFKKVLIFGKTKMGVEKLSTNLYKKGFTVASIHGDKPQFKRQEAIRLFKQNIVSILVATDVAARGIDIPNVTHVINYDEPATYEDYVHRIGRTGRANQKGHAYTFV